MMSVLDNVVTFQKVDELMRICRSAVRKAQAESRQLGVANVYYIDGQVYYELPNGEYTRTPPPLPGSAEDRADADQGNRR